ncbi:polysaccharide deacetylase [Brucella pecoris]|uniref:Chitooligosaccharide deacetylase n=1 Tax=Brucella pecoris TaxID=867683 RepID=A0A5C5CWY3_9HYPH|nr:polysaccharide deacetylase [Brucella pecoris]
MAEVKVEDLGVRGRCPGSPKWPTGKRSAVALAFDLDGPTGGAMLDGSLLDNLRYFTEGSYGPWRALPRLLDLLAEYDLVATFFTPTWVVEQWPERCEAILKAGHEMAYHGHYHEVFIDRTPAEQLAIMQRSAQVFESRLGIKPVGFRTPSGDWSPHTATILKEFGVLYSSSMRGDDRPYFHPGPDGEPGLVEIPGRWDIDDYTALAYFEEPDFPTGHDRIADFRTVEANWRAEFEGFHRDGLCWTTILHPKVSAKLGRLSILEGLFEAIRAHDDVWVARGREIAQWWIDQNASCGEGETR